MKYLNGLLRLVLLITILQKGNFTYKYMCFSNYPEPKEIQRSVNYFQLIYHFFLNLVNL